jgi:hypothetical protein
MPDTQQIEYKMTQQGMRFSFMCNRLFNTYHNGGGTPQPVKLKGYHTEYRFPGWQFDDDYAGTLVVVIDYREGVMEVTQDYFDRFTGEHVSTSAYYNIFHTMEAYNDLTQLAINQQYLI